MFEQQLVAVMYPGSCDIFGIYREFAYPNFNVVFCWAKAHTLFKQGTELIVLWLFVFIRKFEIFQ